MVDQLNAFASEVTRVAREVGTEGRLGGQANVRGVAGTWKDLTENVNSMASNLTGQVRNIAEVTTAVANGDLVEKNHGGRERRNSRAQEHHQHHGGPAERFRRRSDAGGARGRHRRQARWSGTAQGSGGHLEGSRPTSVNSMASNLTGQVRNIAEVATAVAQRRPVEENHRRRCRAKSCSSRRLLIRWWISSAAFAGEVTRVAREVGTEGKLGGQARSPASAGTWKDLTDSSTRWPAT